MKNALPENATHLPLSRPERVPRRIVSLVPSSTESLWDLGVGDRIVGCTRYCVHPAEGLEDVERVGGTKDPKLDRIAALQPDLIVMNREENLAAHAEALSEVAPVLAPHPRTVAEALADLLVLGTFVGREEAAAEMVRQAHTLLEALPPAGGRRILYLIWRKPWMTIGPSTFIAEMIRASGHTPLQVGVPGDYPALTPEALAALRPDEVWLSTEPFPFARKHVDELMELTGWPEERFRMADGELFSWHGSRMLRALRAFSAGSATWPAP